MRRVAWARVCAHQMWSDWCWRISAAPCCTFVSCRVGLAHDLLCMRVQHKHVTIRSRQAGSAGQARHQHGFDVHASRTGSMATRTVLPRPQVGAERQRRVTPCAQTRPSAEKVSYCCSQYETGSRYLRLSTLWIPSLWPKRPL